MKIKRVYEEASAGDGIRILVDRLWPRGISKEKAKIDLWAKELAPSNELRKWFNHDEAKFDVFRQKYFDELDLSDYAKEFKKKNQKKDVTLLFAARNEKYDNAAVLKEWLEK